MNADDAAWDYDNGSPRCLIRVHPRNLRPSSSALSMPAHSLRVPWLTRERLALAGLLRLTLVVRGGVLWTMREKLQDDPDAYREIAENLLQHGVFALGKPEAGAPRDLKDKPQPTA